MNRGTMRTLLGKRLQDTVQDQFSTSDLNALLNVGLSLLQGDVMAIRPDAFVEISTFNLVADQDRYENPEGWLMDFGVEVADSSSPSGYRKLRPLPLQQVPSGDATVYFSYLGKYLVLSPTPSESVTSGGLRTWVPTLTMDDDADIPEIKPVLHTCIVDYAVIEALGETDETAENVRKRLEFKLQRIPDIYARVLVGQTFGLVPNVAR